MLKKYCAKHNYTGTVEDDYCPGCFPTQSALVRAVREDCAKVAEDEWKNADNTRPEYRQNKISHGCLAAAAAIRGK